MLSLGTRCCCGCRSLANLAMLSFGNFVLFAAAVAVYQLSWCCCLVGACFCCLLSFTCCLVGSAYCCCCCSLVIVLVMHYSFGRLVLFAVAIAAYLLSWCGLGACFCCLGAVYCCCCCCCCSFIMIAVSVMHSLGKLIQFTVVVAVYLLPWRLLGVRFFCCCCRSFAVLVMMLYRSINLVLSAAASI
ncbi:hypothetical protein MAM1_1178d11495 [Mucor ambiguus]|uniref:Uncharacterized protein n=1 Tax=Mucor ambiguus TaxID=91626 RepID=A0A0C9MWW9_9FUNG|nr:hypothetical protein MAM1_1178d11495 [Mucor ambiguus]